MRPVARCQRAAMVVLRIGYLGRVGRVKPWGGGPFLGLVLPNSSFDSLLSRSISHTTAPTPSPVRAMASQMVQWNAAKTAQ
jgi:hypothetical protein